MMTFNEMTIDAVEVLFDTFSPVDVVYKPGEGSERTIEALMLYGTEDVISRVHGRVPIQIIVVRNNSTNGITADELSTGTDYIEMPIRQGSSDVKDYSMEIVNQNSAFLRLKVK